jgi:cytochrome c oxidase assembly protein subunit 15
LFVDFRAVIELLAQGCFLKALATPYNPGHHRFAVFVACYTFVLLIAGALVTSNDAGLSVPDWPTSFGSIYKMPPMIGGIKYEHTHRLIAWSVGVMTIAIAIWTWLVERRAWMKRLALAALGTVILQGILGGITVLKFLPPLVSTAHAMVGQTFFCIAVTIALFSGQRWIEEHPRVAFDTVRPSLVSLTQLSVLALYVQLFLGGMFRHHGMSWWPHVVNACAVAVILTWTAVRALSQYSEIREVRRPAILMLSLMVAQLCLGFAAFITRVMWGRDAAQPETPMIVSTVAHTVTGALLLATAVVLAIQVWRHVPVAMSETVPRRPSEAVAA